MDTGWRAAASLSAVEQVVIENVVVEQGVVEEGVVVNEAETAAVVNEDRDAESGVTWNQWRRCKRCTDQAWTVATT